MLFFGGHVGAAERLGTVAYEHERFSADVGDLIIVFGAEKDDLIFLQNPLFAFEAFDRCFALEHEKGFG